MKPILHHSIVSTFCYGIVFLHSYINEAIEKLRLHKDMCAAYIPNGSREGHKNIHERHRGVADLVTFSCGIGDRTATIRIPKAVADSGCGYFEDRRPPANCDPYSVTETIIRILTGTVLNVDGKNKAQSNPWISIMALNVHLKWWSVKIALMDVILK